MSVLPCYLADCILLMSIPNKNKLKLFYDRIHGNIELNILCIDIINTPQFQRLRYIKQLGSCSFVFPSATYSRFEHSIGTAFLSYKLISKLKNNQPELNILDVDVLCVTIAGLCHDLGHGPLSHSFESSFMDIVCPEHHWKHEETSVKMFDHLINSNNLLQRFSEFNIRDEEIDLIKCLILGVNKKDTDTKRHKPFLFEIVNNKITGIDVDKWDYIARDCSYSCLSNIFDHERFISVCKVVEHDGTKRLAIKYKDVQLIYDMFATRNALQRRIYTNKTIQNIDIMFMDALIYANSFLKIGIDNNDRHIISETVNHLNSYTLLNDSIFDLISTSNDTNLSMSKAIISRVHYRKLYHYIGDTFPINPTNQLEVIKNDIINLIKHHLTLSNKNLSLIAIKFNCFSYGMGNSDPVESLCFYLKSDDTVSFNVSRKQISLMLPENFCELRVRLFCRSEQDDDIQISTKIFEICQDFLSRNYISFPMNKSAIL